MTKVNNRLMVRGRFVRDPAVVGAKDGSGRRYVFGRLAVDQPYVDAQGDQKATTAFFELKCFDDTLAEVLIGGGARLGTLIEATGTARLERSQYEKDGESREAVAIAVVLDDPSHHEVAIEAQPRAAAS